MFYLFIIPICLLVLPNIIGALLEKYNKPIPDWYYKFVSFARRAAIYLIGVFLGVIIIGRAIPSTFPSSIIFDNIEKNGLQKTGRAECLLECFAISEEELMEIIGEKDIDFNKSDKDKKIYHFSGETRTNQDIFLKIEVPDTSIATLTDARILGVNCSCESL